jgi:hypothetical protein
MRTVQAGPDEKRDAGRAELSKNRMDPIPKAEQRVTSIVTRTSVNSAYLRRPEGEPTELP